MRLIDADRMFKALQCEGEVDKAKAFVLLARQPTVWTEKAAKGLTAFDVLNIISSVEYGKQRFFLEENGTVFDRRRRDYLPGFEDALDRFVAEMEGEDDI